MVPESPQLGAGVSKRRIGPPEGLETIRIKKEYFQLPVDRKLMVLAMLQGWLNSELVKTTNEVYDR